MGSSPGVAAVEEGTVGLPPVEGDDDSVAPTLDLVGRRCCRRKPKENEACPVLYDFSDSWPQKEGQPISVF